MIYLVIIIVMIILHNKYVKLLDELRSIEYRVIYLQEDVVKMKERVLYDKDMDKMKESVKKLIA